MSDEFDWNIASDGCILIQVSQTFLVDEMQIEETFCFESGEHMANVETIIGTAMALNEFKDHEKIYDITKEVLEENGYYFVNDFKEDFETVMRLVEQKDVNFIYHFVHIIENIKNRKPLDLFRFEIRRDENTLFMFDLLPLVLQNEKCPKCDGQISLIRDGKMRWYNPCPKCGHIKKTKQRDKEHAMRCPKCDTTLVKGPRQSYEMGVEHISNPNKRYYPLRNTYTCPNKKCKVNGAGFYGEDGEFYETPLFSVDHQYWNAKFSVAEEVGRKTERRMKRNRQQKSTDV